MRLIDADALKERITETDSWLMYNEWGSKTLFHEFIDNAPTIESSGDEYVPNKSCFACMERANGMCKGTTQEQSWCPHVARNNTEPSGDLISRAEVLALINKAMDTTDNKDIQDYIFCGLRRDVNNLPSAEYSKLLQTTLNGDLISRADAIEVVCNKCPISFKDKCEWKDNGHCSMKASLEALPSADAISIAEVNEICSDCEKETNEKLQHIKELNARPKGEWIDVEHEPYCECSVCGAYIENLDDDFAFCPRCGADMRGE